MGADLMPSRASSGRIWPDLGPSRSQSATGCGGTQQATLGPQPVPRVQSVALPVRDQLGPVSCGNVAALLPK